MALLLLGGGPVYAQGSALQPAPPNDTTRGIPLDLHGESRFWIRGSSTVNTFTCTVDTVRGDGWLPDAASSVDAASRATSKAVVTVPVDRFDCDNDRMTRDLQETLRADVHPTIRFRLHDATIVSPPDTSGGWYRIEALGHLTVSGTERLVRVHAWGRPLHDSIYRVHGCKVIKMTYFGVEPPTKFFGAVKVHDAIRVHFDLIAEATRTASSTSPTLALTDPPSCGE